MTYEEFLEGWLEYRQGNPLQREGQSYFNFLLNQRPELAKIVQGSSVDPYYFDDWLGECEEWVVENWNSPATD